MEKLNKEDKRWDSRPSEYFTTSTPLLHFQSGDSARPSSRLPSVSEALSYVWEVVLLLLPSYLSRILSRKPVKIEKTTSIEALDGLRGLACLIVFNEHLSASYSKAFYYGYGVQLQGHGQIRTIIQLPIIRTFWAGYAMVATFFVISGYVLSVKPLRQIRAGQTAQFHRTVASAVFRRALRLYLPSIASVLLVGVFSWAGVFQTSSIMFHSGHSGFPLHEAPPARFDSLSTQLLDALNHAWQMCNIWTWDKNSVSPGEYDLHLWTIPVELRSSMVLFLTLIAVAPLQPTFRLLYIGLFATYCFIRDQRDPLLFLLGTFLAEIDTGRLERLQTKLRLTAAEASQRDGARLAWLLIFGIGFWMASSPVFGAEQTFGFRALAAWVPAYYEDAGMMVEAAGGALMVWAVANSSRLKPIFTSGVAAYLGKVSFGLYLVHGSVLKALQYPLLPRLFQMTNGREDMTGFVCAWLMGFAFLFPVALWLADLFWRLIDQPSVAFARWLEGQVTADPKAKDALLPITAQRLK